jgi:hypothetical protein
VKRNLQEGGRDEERKELFISIHPQLIGMWTDEWIDRSIDRQIDRLLETGGRGGRGKCINV